MYIGSPVRSKRGRLDGGLLHTSPQPVNAKLACFRPTALLDGRYLYLDGTQNLAEYIQISLGSCINYAIETIVLDSKGLFSSFGVFVIHMSRLRDTDRTAAGTESYEAYQVFVGFVKHKLRRNLGLGLTAALPSRDLL
jgi:hypothetical protein